ADFVENGADQPAPRVCAVERRNRPATKQCRPELLGRRHHVIAGSSEQRARVAYERVGINRVVEDELELSTKSVRTETEVALARRQELLLEVGRERPECQGRLLRRRLECRTLIGHLR